MIPNVISCWQCIHSIGEWEDGSPTLWCVMKDKEAPVVICQEFERDMGTMEPENE